MAHSIQEFRGRCEIINDLDLMVLFMFLRDLSDDPLIRSLAAWERSLRLYGPGLIHLELDAATEHDTQKFAASLSSVRERLSAFAGSIPACLLNARNITPGVVFTDYPVAPIIDAAMRLENLTSV